MSGEDHQNARNAQEEHTVSILATVPADQIVSVSADLPAPPEEIWGALTDPLRLAGWYGPEDWVVPAHTVTMDLRPGGILRLAMVNHRSPGEVVPLYSTYVSLVENELLEHREALPGPGGEASDAQVLHRIELLEREVQGAPGTRVVVSQGPLPPEVHDAVAQAWRSSLRCLDQALRAEARITGR